MTQIAELFESYETLSINSSLKGKTMRLFGVDLTNELPKEQSRPSSPEQRASRDFIRPQGESSTGLAGQSPIRDFTRHFAQTPYYHQEQGEAFRQQDTPSRVIRPEARRWSQTVESTASPPGWQAFYSQEAQHQTAQPEQPLPNEASSSQQQPQVDPHRLLAARLRVLAEDVEELGRSRSSAPYTEQMAPQPEEMFLSNDGVAISVSDSQSEPSLSSSHKRKRDEASSSRVQPEKEKKLIRSQNQRNAKISEIRKKRKEGKELTEDEQKLIRSYDQRNTINNAKISEIRKKRKEGKELTEDEQKLIRSCDQTSARYNAKISEIRKKRKEGKELTEDEQKLIRSCDQRNARNNAKSSEIRKKQREEAMGKACIS
jgi:hypothetical protein